MRYILKQNKKIILIIGLIFTCFPIAALAQLPEKIAETIKFIQAKTAINRECGIEYCIQRVSFSEDGCEVTSKQIYSEARFEKPKLIFTGKVHLKAINPQTITIPESAPNEIRLHTREGKKAVINSENEVVAPGDTFYLFTDKPEDAPRVVKAFSFLIEICGGGGELY